MIPVTVTIRVRGWRDHTPPLFTLQIQALKICGHHHCISFGSAKIQLTFYSANCAVLHWNVHSGLANYPATENSVFNLKLENSGLNRIPAGNRVLSSVLFSERTVGRSPPLPHRSSPPNRGSFHWQVAPQRKVLLTGDRDRGPHA